MSFLIPVSTIDYLFSKLNLNTTNYSSADKLNKLKELGKLNSFPSFVKSVESQKRTPILDAFGINLNKKYLNQPEKIIARDRSIIAEIEDCKKLLAKYV